MRVSEVARRGILERFAHAIQTQDKAVLLALLADGASWTSDDGGKARAALKVIRGRERVARFVLAVLGRYADLLGFETISANGEPALALRVQDKLFSVITVNTDGIRILDVYTVLNPTKLAAAPAASRG